MYSVAAYLRVYHVPNDTVCDGGLNRSDSGSAGLVDVISQTRCIAGCISVNSTKRLCMNINLNPLATVRLRSRAASSAALPPPASIRAESLRRGRCYTLHSISDHSRRTGGNTHLLFGPTHRARTVPRAPRPHPRVKRILRRSRIKGTIAHDQLRDVPSWKRRKRSARIPLSVTVSQQHGNVSALITKASAMEDMKAA